MTRKPCVVPNCPFVRGEGSWLCAAHEKDAQAKRPIVDAVQQAKPKKKRTPAAPSRHAVTFLQQCRFANLPAPIPEYTFHPTRKWRADFGFLDARILMEIEGGAFKKDGGRHTRGAGFRNDLKKYAEAAILGWRVIRVLPEWIDDGQALMYIERALTDSNKTATVSP